MKPRMLSIAACIGATAFASPAEACPDWRLNGVELNLSSDELYFPRLFNRRAAGGRIDIGPCPVPGYGFVARRPDYTIRYDPSNQSRDLEFRVDAPTQCDTILLINLPDASWQYDDDGGDGLNPKLRLEKAAAGIYDVWLGRRYAGASCRATLTIETF